jgi:hypothetical protein
MAFGWGSKTKKWQIEVNLHDTFFWRENQLVPTKSKSSKESSWFGEPRCKLGSRHGPTQGFNLLQMNPNWFLGIWTLDPI